MNPLQSAAIQTAINGENLFLTGPAGVGKSFCLRDLIRRLKHEEHKNVTVTASTGIAATAIGGSTPYSVFRINPFKIHEKPKYSKDAAKAWNETDVLILEECSMIVPELLDYLNGQAQICRKSKEPMGGVQVIFCGDFFQLPPIKDKKRPDPRDFIFETKVWHALDVQCIELEKVYRQDDADFVALLHRIRRGEVTISDNKYLANGANGGHEKNEHGIEPTVLFCHRAKVDAQNLQRSRALPGREHTFRAQVTAKKGRLTDKLREKAFKRLTVGKTCVLKVGSQVSMAVNRWIKYKVANGSRGVVIGFDERDHYFPWVQFNHVKIKVRPYQWNIQFTKKSAVVVTAMPLKLAWASTIHSSQGASIDYLTVDVSGAFAHGQMYVALSRATNKEHLLVKGYNPRNIKVNPKVKAFYLNEMKKVAVPRFYTAPEDKEEESEDVEEEEEPEDVEEKEEEPEDVEEEEEEPEDVEEEEEEPEEAEIPIRKRSSTATSSRKRKRLRRKLEDSDSSEGEEEPPEETIFNWDDLDDDNLYADEEQQQRVPNPFIDGDAVDAGDT